MGGVTKWLPCSFRSTEGYLHTTPPRLAPTVFSLRAGEMLLLLLLNILAQRFGFVNNKLIDLQNRSEENLTPFLYKKVEIGKTS